MKQLEDFQGPVTKRSCQDTFWLLLFVVFWIGMGLITWQATTVADVLVFTYSKDSSGHHCGMANQNGPDYTNKSNLYFINPFDRNSQQICVNQCPETTSLSSSVQSAICINGITVDSSNIQSRQNEGKCSTFTYASKSRFSRCMPINMESLLALNITGSQYQVIVDYQDEAVKVVGDFATTFPWILVFAGIAAGISIVAMILLRFIVAFYVWTAVILAALVVNGFAAFMYFTWQSAKVSSSGYVTEGQINNERTYFGLFIAACIIAGMFDLVLIAIRNRLRIAIQVLKEASLAVKAMPTLSIFSFTTAGSIVVLIGYWLFAELYVASVVRDPTISDQQVGYFKYSQWYLLFGLFWGVQFISGVAQTTIAGAVATWYWAEDKRAMKKHPVLKSLERTLKYSLGSIAFGSLFVAVIQIIRVFVVYSQKSVKKLSSNKTRSYMLACFQCFLTVLEKITKFINKNAYIEIALYGKSFCWSSSEAFQILTRNAFRLLAIDLVSSFVLFTTKLSVAGLCGAGSYYFFLYTYGEFGLYYSSSSVFVIMVQAFVVASVFLNVYEVAVDTIFISFCEDIERNDGTEHRPYLMSRNLQALASVENKQFPKLVQDPESIIATRQAFVDNI